MQFPSVLIQNKHHENLNHGIEIVSITAPIVFFLFLSLKSILANNNFNNKYKIKKHGTTLLQLLVATLYDKEIQ